MCWILPARSVPLMGEKFARPKLEGKVVCSLLHKAVLHLDVQQLRPCFMMQKLSWTEYPSCLSKRINPVLLP